MSMPPMSMSAASRSTYHQASAVISVRLASTIAVSRPGMRLRRPREGAVVSAHNAALRHVEIHELRVRVRELEAERLLGLRPPAADLRERILEPVRHVDADAVLGACDRVLDRLSTSCGDTRDDEART